MELIAKFDCDSVPPDLKDVADFYKEFEEDLPWMRNLAEVLRRATIDHEQPPWINNIRHSLLQLDETELFQHDRQSFRRTFGSFYANESDEEMYRLPTAQVLGSEHTNPLESTIVITGALAVLLLSSILWAVRKWKRIIGEEKFIQTRNEILQTINNIISEGDPEKVKAVEPIALGILATAVEHHAMSDKIEVEFPSIFKFGMSETRDQ